MELDLERELAGPDWLPNDSGCRFFPHWAIFGSRICSQSDYGKSPVKWMVMRLFTCMESSINEICGDGGYSP